MRRSIRYAIYSFLSIFLIVLVMISTSLSNAAVELTSGGVYRHIYLPLGFGDVKWNAQGRLQATDPALTHFQGPVIERLQDKLKVSAYCYNKAVILYFPLDTAKISLECQSKQYSYHIAPPVSTSLTEHSLPDKVAVISDLEGNVSYFDAWAQQLGIINDKGDWQYDDGHIVILGDAVDRGRATMDLLWRLYDLDLQAKKTSGRVWLIAGNHEQYVLRGLVDRVETEHLWAIEQLMRYEDAFSSRTVLGQWLRAQPVILKLDDYLLTHGGVSPSVLNSRLSVAELNIQYQHSLNNDTVSDEEFELFYGSQSLTQYRALIKEYADDDDSRRIHLNNVHDFFQTRYLVIGHTPVPTLRIEQDTGLIAIETDDHGAQVLVIENGVPTIHSLDTLKNNYYDPKPIVRPFQILNVQDWKALVPEDTFMQRLNKAKAFFNHQPMAQKH